MDAHTADVGAIDEAEEIEQGYCRHDVEVDLAPELGLCLGIESDE